MTWKEINKNFSRNATKKGVFWVRKKKLIAIQTDWDKEEGAEREIASRFARIGGIRKVYSKSGEKFELLMTDLAEKRTVPTLHVSRKKDFQLVLHRPYLLIWYMKQQNIQIFDQQQLLEAYKIYIDAEIDWHYENNAFQSLDFGWKKYPKRGYEYVGVDRDSIQLKVEEAFLGDDLGNVQESASIVLPFMNQFPQLLPLFGYLFYSLSRKLFELHGIALPSPFGLAISGRNTHTTPAALANLILNMFDVDMHRPHAIKRGINISADTISHHTLLNKMFLHDVILLVYNKARSLAKTNASVKTIITDIEDIDYAPVFVTKDVLRDDSILTVDIANVPDLRVFSHDLHRVREAISRLLLEFINDLGREMNACLRNQANDNLYKTLSYQYLHFIDNEYADDDVAYYAALYISLLLFLETSTMRKNCLQRTRYSIRDQAFQTMTKLSYCHQLPEAAWEDLFCAYIRAIFVEKTHQVSFEHWEAEERNGKEECLYLSYHAYFADFCSFANLDIKQIALQQLLLERRMIKVRSDARTKGSYRKYNNQSLYTLVILKSAVLDVANQESNEDRS